MGDDITLEVSYLEDVALLQNLFLTTFYWSKFIEKKFIGQEWIKSCLKALKKLPSQTRLIVPYSTVTDPTILFTFKEVTNLFL